MTDKNANTEIRKEFCPNCEAETPCTHEAELYVCDICGEDFAKYIVSRNCNVSDVSMTRDVLIDIKTPRSIENTKHDYYKQELARLREEQRWIPVSERLPIPAQKADGYISDSSELVHVYPMPKNDRAVCYLHYLGKWSCSAEVNVTHWRPIPKPPQEREA